VALVCDQEELSMLILDLVGSVSRSVYYQDMELTCGILSFRPQADVTRLDAKIDRQIHVPLILQGSRWNDYDNSSIFVFNALEPGARYRKCEASLSSSSYDFDHATRAGILPLLDSLTLP
jgi:hypothetical protein